MSNKSNGTAFEREFSRMLAANGFWAHCIKDNENGQPFDVIAAKDGIAYAFDCKDCSQERFPFSRIEENQRTAMKLWYECGNGEPIFAIRFPLRGVRMISISTLMEMEDNGYTVLAGVDIDVNTMPFEGWAILI